MAQIGETTSSHRSIHRCFPRVRALSVIVLGILLALNTVLLAACLQHPESGTAANAIQVDGAKGGTAHTPEAGGVGFYGDLKLGMSREQAFAHLPEGIFPEGLEQPLRFSIEKVSCWTGRFPTLRIPMLKDAGLPEDTITTLALWFDADQLVSIVLETVQHDPTEEVAQRLRNLLVDCYGQSNEERQKQEGYELLYSRQGEGDWIVQGYREFNSDGNLTSLIVEVRVKESDALAALEKSGDSGTRTYELEQRTFLARNTRIRRFETLRFGMTEEEALNNLPWGLAPDDLPLRWSAGDADYVYGESIPLSKWPPTANAFKNKDGTFQFSLGFTNDGLQIVFIALGADLVDFATIKKVRQYIDDMFENNLAYSVESTGYEGWSIHGDEGDVEISVPFAAQDDLLRITIGTKEGTKAYTEGVASVEGSGTQTGAFAGS
jgi:hypothetical protein